MEEKLKSEEPGSWIEMFDPPLITKDKTHYLITLPLSEPENGAFRQIVMITINVSMQTCIDDLPGRFRAGVGLWLPSTDQSKIIEYQTEENETFAFSKMSQDDSLARYFLATFSHFIDRFLCVRDEDVFRFAHYFGTCLWCQSVEDSIFLLRQSMNIHPAFWIRSRNAKFDSIKCYQDSRNGRRMYPNCRTCPRSG